MEGLSPLHRRVAGMLHVVTVLIGCLVTRKLCLAKCRRPPAGPNQPDWPLAHLCSAAGFQLALPDASCPRLQPCRLIRPVRQTRSCAMHECA
jgi:hypothetical protein